MFSIGYNVSILHSIPLVIALTNIFTNQWVRYVGTVTLDDIIDIDIELNWGLYSIDVITPIFNDIPFQLSIPNFIQYASNNVGIDFFKPTTLPLYYTVYVLYLLFLLNDIYHSLIGIHEPRVLTKENMKRRLMHVLAITRILLGIFFIWSLFTYYGTTSLCINKHIKNTTTNQPLLYFSGNKNGHNEICTYEWNIVTIIIGEIISYGLAIHKLVLCSYRRRPRSNTDDDDNDNDNNNVGIHFTLLQQTDQPLSSIQ